MYATCRQTVWLAEEENLLYHCMGPKYKVISDHKTAPALGTDVDARDLMLYVTLVARSNDDCEFKLSVCFLGFPSHHPFSEIHVLGKFITPIVSEASFLLFAELSIQTCPMFHF